MATNLKRLEGKVALVTGSGSGIDEAIAARFPPIREDAEVEWRSFKLDSSAPPSPEQPGDYVERPRPRKQRRRSDR
jgi:hypothetical protein